MDKKNLLPFLGGSEPFSLELAAEYFSVTAGENLYVSFVKNYTGGTDNHLQYNIENTGWVTYTLGTQISLLANQTVMFKNTDNYFADYTGISDNSLKTGYTLKIDNANGTNKGKANVFGTILALRNNNTAVVGPYEFINLFNNIGTNSSSDADRPVLTGVNFPLGTDAQSTAAYKQICSNSKIKNPPTLPTSYTSAIMNFYYEAFKGCTSLTAAPSLPATKLDSSCYYRMFSGCTSLKTPPPSLPAVSATSNCYYEMFKGCTSLTATPTFATLESIEAQSLMSMFEGCTSLKTPPTTIGKSDLLIKINGCADMFANCTSLTAAPTLPALSTGTWGYFGMFSGCTNLKNAPSLPATNFGSDVYAHMFHGCTSLTGAPALNKSSLVGGDYQHMFDSCTSLKNTPTTLPATTISVSCYMQMFRGCTSLTGVPASLPATTAKQGCYYGMFQDCTSLTASPLIKLTTFAPSCCMNMFRDCSNLKKITVNFTSWGDATDAFTNWVYGVAANGTFYKPVALPTEFGVNRIPVGWTVVNYDYVPDTNGITFVSKGNTTIQLIGGSESTHTFKYKYTNQGVWTSYTPGTSISLANGEEISFSGSTAKPLVSRYRFSTTGGTITTKSTSNITHLLNGAQTISGSHYSSLFSGCVGLVTAPALTATNLNNSTNCYKDMFAGCTSLTAAPALPGTNPGIGSFSAMFSGCTALTVAPPSLPATTLATNTYADMFADCTSLVTGPQFPSNSITPAKWSFRSMFSGCTSLKIAPSFRITSPIWGSCSCMFLNCTALTAAPVLNVTHWNGLRAFENMFKGCTSLKWVGGTSTNGIDVFNQQPSEDNMNLMCKLMFAGCTSLTGINISNFNITYAGDGTTSPQSSSYRLFKDMFSGCIALTEPGINSICVPTLPESSLVGNTTNGDENMLQFAGMFQGCTSLNKRIAIQVPTFGYLAQKEFSGMFKGCTSLQSGVLMSGMWRPMNKTCESMFEGCTNLKRDDFFQETYGIVGYMIPGPSSCYNMFKGCTALTAAIFPTYCKTTNDSCFKNMYEGCTGLKTATLPVHDLTNNCYQEMFKGCTSLTGVDIKGISLDTNSCLAMFSGCSQLTYIKVNFTDWRDDLHATTNWVVGVAGAGTFVKPTALPLIQDASHIPEGWNVVNDDTDINENGRGIVITPNSTTTIMFKSDDGWETPPDEGHERLISLDYRFNWDGSPTPVITNQSILIEPTQTMIIKSRLEEVMEWNDGMYDFVWDYGSQRYLFGNRHLDLAHFEANNVYIKVEGQYSVGGLLTDLGYIADLSSTTQFKIAPNMFYRLFYNNTNLVDAKQLKLFPQALNDLQKYSIMYMDDEAEGLYEELFAGCTSLTAAPDIPDVSFESGFNTYKLRGAGIFKNMFSGCTALSTAPKIPDYGTGNSELYAGLFKGCSKLNYIEVNFTDWDSGNNMTQDWVSGVAAAGTFVKPETLPLQRGNSYIPNSWTVQEKPNDFYIRLKHLDSQNTGTLTQNFILLIPGNSSIAMNDSNYVGENGNALFEYKIIGNGDWTQWNRSANSLAIQGNNDATGVTVMIKGYDQVPYSRTKVVNICPVKGNETYNVNQRYVIGGPISSLLPNSDYINHNYYDRYISFSACFAGQNNLVDASDLIIALPPLFKTQDWNYGDEYQGTVESCFKWIFSGCPNLTAVPQLPATNLQYSYYEGMFEGCTGLSSVPDDLLPATDLVHYVYWDYNYNTIESWSSEHNTYAYMFCNCTSLTDMPNLPATKINDGSYRMMFAGCTSLTGVKDIEALSGEARCCLRMFEGCTSLLKAPNINIITRNQHSDSYSNGILTGMYNSFAGMFAGCTSLKVPPSALKLDYINNNTYQNMFSGCTALTAAPTIISTNVCYYDGGSTSFQGMFSGLTNLAKGPLLIQINTMSKNVCEGMFSGCTALTSAPQLVTNALSAACYYQMFAGCTSLTSIPTNMLPSVTTAPSSCYQNMFSGCTSLTSAPTLNTITNFLRDACRHMFAKCSSLINVTNLFKTNSNITIGMSSFFGMFSGCTSLRTAPTLPTTTLTSGCYQNMFAGCSSLTGVPTSYLSSTNLAAHCYAGMFSGCTSMTNATKLPATTLASSCYAGMFAGCSSLVYTLGWFNFPATTAPNCYASMFARTKSIVNSSNALPALTMTSGCYASMFQATSGLGTVPTLPATTLAPSCYYQMFRAAKFTSANQSITLPATTLVDSCYASMFYDCSGVVSAFISATVIPDASTMNWMFWGCKNLAYVEVNFTSWPSGGFPYWLASVSSTGTFKCPSKLPHTSTYLNKSNYIPQGWTVVTK